MPADEDTLEIKPERSWHEWVAEVEDLLIEAEEQPSTRAAETLLLRALVAAQTATATAIGQASEA